MTLSLEFESETGYCQRSLIQPSVVPTQVQPTMSSNPGATGPLSAELGQPLESSLTHLVENSKTNEGGGKDDLARVSSFYRY